MNLNDSDDSDDDLKAEEYHDENIVVNGKAEVIEAVDKHGHKEGAEDVEPFARQVAGALGAFGEAVEPAHEHGIDSVTRHRQQAAHHGDLQRSLAHDVEDIFDRGKAQRHRHGIDHRIEGIVEAGVAPGADPQNEELAGLLAERHDNEVLDQHIGIGAFFKD